MQGSKPLEKKEIQDMLSEMTSLRNKCLFILGLKTGFRISEILSLTFKDLTEFGDIKDSVTVSRSNMKGKLSSRSVVLHVEAKTALSDYFSQKSFLGEERIFPISRMQASRIIKNASIRARVRGKVTTHSMRKSFAKRVHYALNKDLVATQKALGHKSINSTVSYLSFEQSEIDKAIRGI